MHGNVWNSFAKQSGMTHRRNLPDKRRLVVVNPPTVYENSVNIFACSYCKHTLGHAGNDLMKTTAKTFQCSCECLLGTDLQVPSTYLLVPGARPWCSCRWVRIAASVLVIKGDNVLEPVSIPDTFNESLRGTINSCGCTDTCAMENNGILDAVAKTS